MDFKKKLVDAAPWLLIVLALASALSPMGGLGGVPVLGALLGSSASMVQQLLGVLGIIAGAMWLTQK